MNEDGFFRCPNRCGHPDYPQPKWKTEAGFNRHLEKCKGRPDVPEMPAAVTKEPSKPYQDCPECGEIIFEMETVWMFRGRIKCIRHWQPGEEGHVDCAGLELPGMDEFAG